MENYHALIQELLQDGSPKEDRTGTGTWSLFGRQLRYHLPQGFPLLTTKKVHFKSVAHELLWFLRGDTNARSLNEVGVSIWDEWADADGHLGPVYGAQWRRWRAAQGEIDQLAAILAELKANPDSRRLVVSTWNVGELPSMALYPCHVLFQLYVAQGALSLHMYQRSADAFLGLPFNIASYALLAHMIAQECGLAVGDLVLSLGDVHLYRNHEQQARELLRREHRPLPLLELDPSVKSVFAFQYEHIQLRNYVPHPPLPAPVAV